MTSRRLTLAVLIVLTLCSQVLPALSVDALLLGFSQAWTGNGYAPTPADPGGPYDFDVTGSEAMPIDPFVGFGARLSLMETESGALTLSPALQAGRRYYLLYASGRVVPSQIETAAGAEGDTPGIGSARVVSLRIPLPIGYELRVARAHTFSIAFSPTIVIRVPGGDVALKDEDGDLSGMWDYFYGRMRFLMPELVAAYRFTLSEYLETTLFATYGVSVLDLADPDLPWYDQMRVAAGIELGLRFPLTGLAREREDRLPEGVEPFPQATEAVRKIR